MSEVITIRPTAASYRTMAGQLRRLATTSNHPENCLDAALECDARADMAILSLPIVVPIAKKIAKKSATLAAIVAGVVLLSIAW